jgi:hypothetical protein
MAQRRLQKPAGQNLCGQKMVLAFARLFSNNPTSNSHYIHELKN